MSWYHFQAGEKKKGSKRQPRETKKSSLVTEDLEQEVDDSVTEMFSQASNELIKFLTEKQEDAQEEIRTAVVCCSFSHVGIFRKALETDLKSKVFRINKDSQVRNIIETAKQSKSPGVLLIEQIESLSAEFVENLLYLSKWFNLQHPFVICTSTGVSSFSDMCSFDTLKSINAEIFNMPKSEDIYDEVIKCVLRKCQLDKIHLSGKVLTLLRSRFFCNSFSVEEIKKTIRICVNHHNWQLDRCKNVEGRDAFEVSVGAYWQNLNYYASTVEADLFKCHEEIQTGKFRATKQFRAVEMAEWMKLGHVPIEVRTEVNVYLKAYFQRISENDAKDTEMDTSTNVPATSKRMTANELKKEQEKIRTARLAALQSRPEVFKEDAYKVIISKLLCSWENFPQCDQFLIRDEPRNVLYCDPAALVENALLLDTNKNEPLAVAFRSLHQRGNWKTTKISDWLKNYESEYATNHKENTTSSFYAALGQLESMGAVKASFERSKDSVTILHHPISYVLN